MWKHGRKILWTDCMSVSKSWKKNVFTIARVDNVDHNTSSTTAITSFQGTSISLIQHPNVEGEGVSNAVIKQRNLSATKTIAPLPSCYTNIPPLSSHKQGGLKMQRTLTQCNLKRNEEEASLAIRKETRPHERTLEERKVRECHNSRGQDSWKWQSR